MAIMIMCKYMQTEINQDDVAKCNKHARTDYYVVHCLCVINNKDIISYGHEHFLQNRYLRSMWYSLMNL